MSLVAGACVVDAPRAAFDEAAYGRQLESIAAVNGTPVIFPSYGLTSGSDADMILRYQRLAQDVERFIGFELSSDLPSGRLAVTFKRDSPRRGRRDNA